MASPEDLVAQRNKLQHEILELENSLGNDSNLLDLMLLNSDSADDSDDSGHADEEVQGYDDLEAERQQIQKEIEELEKTLGADAALIDTLTDSEQGSDVNSSDEDEELNLPQDLNTCLQLNLVYQEVIKEKLTQLEHHLNENRQQQKELEVQLSGSVSNVAGLPHLKVFLGSFMKPYFKDKLTGLGPPSNEETKERLSNVTRLCDELKIRRWEAWQKSLLMKAIATDTMKRMIQPKMSKMEYLNAKMTRVEEEEKEAIKLQISALEKEIAEISSMKDEELYGDCYADHDWDKISNVDFEGLRHSEDLMRFWQNYLHPSINKSAWKEDEIDKLAKVSEQYNDSHWDQIAVTLGTNRTAFMCFQIYQRYISKTFKKREWTKEEDQVLRGLVEKMRVGNFIPYTQMSYFMEGRDYTQLLYRWTTVLDPSIKKGHWSKHEDQLLLNAVRKYGCKDWWKIKYEVPGRTDNACRDRYLDCLREDVKRGTWSDDEVQLLKKMVAKHGVGKWSKIAAEIPNRIDSQCLHKWKTIMKNEALKRGPSRNIRLEPQRKRRNVELRKTIKKEEDCETLSESSSEDETIHVKEFGSDTEGENNEGSATEKNVEPKIKYIQSDMKKWIPVGVKPHGGNVKLTVVKFTSDAEDQTPGETCLNICLHTVLDNTGKPVKTIRGVDPPVLQKWDLCDKNAMFKVSQSEVERLLMWMRSTTLRRKTPISRIDQQNELSEEQEIEIKSQNRKRKRFNGGSASFHFALMMAISPWIGNILMSVPIDDRCVCEADNIRNRAAECPLTKTPIFLFLLKVLQIDSEGCRKVIESRTQTVSLIPVKKPKPASSYRGRTVGQMLEEKQLKDCPLSLENVPALPHPLNDGCKTSQQVYTASQLPSPALIVPQTFVIAQPNVQQGVRPVNPVVNGNLPLVLSGAQGISQVPRAFLQVPVPVESGKLVQQSSSSTTTTSNLSTTGSPINNVNQKGKRKRKPTIKAQALMESRSNMASKMQSKMNQTSSPKNIPLLPKTTAWVLTTTHLVPLAGLQITYPPSLNLGQNATLSNASINLGVSTPQVPPHTPSVASAGTGTLGVPVISSNPAVSVSVNGTTIQTPPPNIESNQQRVFVPQVTCQSPLLVNQNGALALVCNSVNPAIPSIIPAVNSSNISDSSVVSGSNAAKSSSVPVSNVHSISVNTMTSSIPTNITGPVLLSSPNGTRQEEAEQPTNTNNTSTNNSGISQITAMSVSKNPPNSEILKVTQSSAAATSPGTVQATVVNGPGLPNNYSLSFPVPSLPVVQIGANVPISHVTPHGSPAVVLQIPSQDKVQTVQRAAITTVASPDTNTLNCDPRLVFCEDLTEVKRWMNGEGGISVPHTETSLPYLPPFVSNINTLMSLLKVKQSLLRSAEQLLPEEDQEISEEAKIKAIRQLVAEKYQKNPAYLLLKARFLSCFTLPALLATIHPCKQATDAEDKEDEESENGDELECNEDQDQLQAKGSLMSTSDSEVSASPVRQLRPRRKSSRISK